MNATKAISTLIQAGRLTSIHSSKNESNLEYKDFLAAMEYICGMEAELDKLKSIDNKNLHQTHVAAGHLDSNSSSSPSLDAALDAAEGRNLPFPGWRWGMNTWRKGLPCGGMIEVSHGTRGTESSSWYPPFACFFLKNGLKATPLRGETVYEVIRMAEEWIANEYPAIVGK